MSAGPLAGVRVLDLTHHLGGPLATMYLAQLGADVVKVEPPSGDEWRHVDSVRGESRQFHAVNRDKRGMVLDLKTAEGKEAFGRLVDRADVLVHSFAPGVAERLGAGAEETRARNPRLVYCALSAFGPSGRRGTDVALQAESGLAAANGQRAIPVPAHDTLVPFIMVSGILAALYERERSGEIILGVTDMPSKSILIVDVIAAPSDSQSSNSHFIRGREGQEDLLNDVLRRTANIVDYIGEWHSHPNNYSTKPSEDDKQLLGKLSKLMSKEGLPSVMLISGETGISIYVK